MKRRSALLFTAWVLAISGFIGAAMSGNSNAGVEFTPTATPTASPNPTAYPTPTPGDDPTTPRKPLPVTPTP